MESGRKVAKLRASRSPHRPRVQRIEQQVARNAATGARHGASDSGGAHADPSLVRKPNPGWFAPGNAVRLKHGRYSKAVREALLPEQAAVLNMLAEREAAIIVDLGGAESLSTFERDLVRKYQQLDCIAEFNAGRMFSARATVRRESREAFMSIIDRQLKIIAQLGLRRRAKDVTGTPLGWIEGGSSVPHSNEENGQTE